MEFHFQLLHCALYFLGPAPGWSLFSRVRLIHLKNSSDRITHQKTAEVKGATVKNFLVAVLAGTTLQGVTFVTNAPWAVVLVVLATLVTCLASLYMSYKQVRKLASLDGTASVEEGLWGIRWRALSDPKDSESKESKARGPRPRRWSQRE